jgi:trigger factor
MNIRRIPVSPVNEIIEIEVTLSDYKGQVAKKINEKMPLATVKGFRKGAVPKDLVEKQYGKAIKQEEVKKVVDMALERYIATENLNMLGMPIAIEKEIFNWDLENLTFQYEIGLAPFFDVDLEAKTDIVNYKVTADAKLINDQVVRIQKQYGTEIVQEIVTESTDLEGIFTNEAHNINNPTYISFDIFKDKNIASKFVGKKVGDVVTLSTKGLFEDDHMLMDYLKVDHDEVHNLEIEVDFKIDAIIEVQPAALNQELFDKLFGERNIGSLADLKAKIKEDSENSFANQEKTRLKYAIQDFHIKNTIFDLPKEFLIKWFQTTGEQKMTEDQAKVEYLRSESALRWQMIEGQAIAKSNIKINFEDLKSFTTDAIKKQMAQYGQYNPTAEEVEGIVARILANQDEVKRLSAEVVKEKMVQIMIEKANLPQKEVTYPEFVAAMYGE